MRIALAGLVVLFVLSVTAEEIVEPTTKEAFPAAMRAGDALLRCTGVTVRKKYGFDIYALAHYGDSTSNQDLPKAEDARLRYWQTSDVAKAFVIHFVFFVDEGNLRQACEDSLTEAGYAGEKQAAFLDVFAKDYAAGSELRLIAGKKGALIAELNGEVMGKWQDPKLVSALWQSWLGESSEVHDRGALVSHGAESQEDSE